VSHKHSHRLAIDADGTLHGEHLRYLPGSSSWEASLWSRSPDGTISTTYGPAPGFPPSLLRDAAGHRYEWRGRRDEVSRLVRRAADGTITPLAGSDWGLVDGAGERALLRQVVALAWGPDGRIYVTDDASVRRVSLDGRVETLATGFGTENLPDLPHAVKLWGLALDPRGHVYVANYGQRRMLEITPEGATTTLLVAEPPWSPTGVACAAGAVYVLEHGFVPPDREVGPRVRVRDAAGAVRVLATLK
jgi:DNA-binding beta-propeller fold protein YncE